MGGNQIYCDAASLPSRMGYFKMVVLKEYCWGRCWVWEGECNGRLKKTVYWGASWFVLFREYYLGNQIKKDELCTVCVACVEEEKCVQSVAGETWGRERPLGRPHCSWEDNIKIDFKEVGWWAWIVWICMWTWTSGALYTKSCTSVFYKRQGISRLGEKVTALTVKLVSWFVTQSVYEVKKKSLNL